jgi:hypothetical protein
MTTEKAEETTMPEMTRIEEDLGYVRAAVARMDRSRSPAAIYFLWAAIVVAGFSLVDLAPRAVGLYWLVAGPGGFVLSVWLGWRASRRAGEMDRAEGLRHMLHWFGLLAAGVLAVLPVAAGQASWYGFAATMVLLTALAYWLAGVHGDRAMLAVGALLGAGYAVIVLVPGPVWTITGLLIGAAMAAAGWSAGRRRAPEAG